MKRTPFGVALAAGTVALLAFTACAPRDDGGQAGGAGFAPVTELGLVEQLPAATTPVDKVIWSLSEGEPGTLDPAESAQLVTPNLCDNLLRLQPDFSIEPGVAASAEWEDPTTFVIDLHDDVTFWDGSPVTPEDVVYSLERNRNPESHWYAAFVLVDTIEKSGGHQVTVKFTAPDTTFRDALSGGGSAVMSKAYGEEVGDRLGTSEGGLMCSGPFKLDEGGWTPGSDIVTTANHDYRDGAPLVEEMKYIFVGGTSALTTALTEGEIDGAFNVAPSSRKAFETEGAGRLILGPSTQSYQFGTASSSGPMTDPKIRQALSHAIDREQFIRTVLNGLGTTQKTIVPPFVFNKMAHADIYAAAHEALPDPEFDMEKAQALVDESDADLSVPITVAVPSGAKEFQQTAQIMQDAAKKLGITVEINEMQASDFGAIFFDPAAREGIDSLATTGYLDTPGVLGYPSLFMLPPSQGGAFNWSGFDDQEVVGHLQAARTATDERTAAEEFVKAQEIFAPLQLQIKLANAYQLTYLSNDLTGVTTSIAVYNSLWALHLGAE